VPCDFCYLNLSEADHFSSYLDVVATNSEMDIRTLLYLILGMPLFISAATTQTGAPISRRQLPQSRSLRSSHRRGLPPADPPSFFVPSSAKLPLAALATRDNRNSHLHPQLLLQQHLNRGITRHSRMTKKSHPPFDDDELQQRLARNLQKRWESVQSVPSSPKSPLSRQEKRWRGGEALAGATAAMQHMKERVASVLSGSSARTASSNVGLAAASARVGVSGVAGATVAASRAARISATAGNSTAGDETDSEDDEAGFDRLEYDAAMNNSNLEAEPVTAANSLGLTIEANDVGA
jgi:hypothetical protein